MGRYILIMAVVRIALLVLTYLVITGCNKSEETQQSAPVEQTRVQAPKVSDSRKVLLIFGDSLSEVGADQGVSFPDLLQKRIDAKGYAWRVVNQGASGDTTSDGVNRMQAAIDAKPQILVLELGGNDGLRGIPTAASRKNLETMIETFQKAGIRVVLAGMSLPPNYGADYIRSFEAMYRELADQYKLTLIPFLLSDIARQLAKRPGLLGSDGIHPTPEGNQVVADTVMRAIEPLIVR